MISAALPIAQALRCRASVADRVTTLPDSFHLEFGTKDACVMKEVRLLRRIVFLIDRRGRVGFSSYMRTIGEEPVYNDAIERLRSALR